MSWNEYNSLYMKLYTYANQLQLCKNNYNANLMQLVCNHHGNVMLMLLFINPSKFNMWHYEGFWVELFFFEILISTIHYDYSSYIVTRGKIKSCHVPCS
jgi:hypothetical protein